jgi:predicted MFS family arabinose efflux permease
VNAENSAQPVSEWRSGGAVLAVAMLGMIACNVASYVVGVLVKPLGAEFGWSRAAVSSGILIAALGTFTLSPIVGPLLDRIGARRVALWGVPMMAIGIGSIGLSGPSVYSWFFCWGLYAVGQAFANVVVWSAAIVCCFDKHRGKALGLFMAGAGMFYGVGPKFAAYVLTHHGWRMIFFIIAAFIVIVTMPLVIRYFKPPLRQPAQARPASAGETPASADRTLTAMRTRQFWQIAFACAISAGSVSALLVHLVPILTDANISLDDAASAAFVIGPTSVIGRLMSGYLLDHLPPNLVGAGILVCSGLPYAILAFGDVSITIGFICAIFIGFAAGAEADLLAYLTSRYFRPAMFGRVFSILMGIFSVGFGIGPIVAGAVFDASSSYAPIFITMTIVASIGALLIIALGKPAPREDAHAG